MLNEVSRELIINFQLTSASFTHKKIPFTRNNPLQREFLGEPAYLVRPKQIFIFSHTSSWDIFPKTVEFLDYR